MENEKKNKNKFWKGVLVGALVTAFAGLVIVGIAAGISIIGHTVMGGQGIAGIIESSGSPEEESLNYQRIGNKLDLLEQVVDNYFLFEENVDTEQMEAGIYKGMLAGLEDPYTTYYTAEEYRAMTEETEGVYCGIGVQVSQNLETGIITILRVFPGSPAEEAGLKKGDILYKVGALDVYDQELDTLVSQYIRGEEGTFVDLTVLRDGEEISATVERRMVESVTVESQLLPDKTGYVMVTQFDLVTADQFISAVDSLEKQGMERLVIDLRDNPGGVVDACVKMAAYLLPEDQYDGTILSTADKNGEGDRYYCQDGKLLFEGSGSNPEYPMDDGHELNMPIAVLINGMSASASEVFAGALRDYGMATLVGTTSFGKGIVQALLPLDDGSAVKVTIAHYYTPAGHDIHKKGLEPDVEIPLELDEDLIGQYDVPLDRDNQVQKAIEVLKQ
uniref:S41 family peptidase n=1 Tax=Candidatus Ventrimonas sp. TaxID=3048889 RepID=UPI003FEF94A4